MIILVTGATGSVGRLVVDHLLAAGANVRALTNHPQRAGLPAEVEVIEGFLGRLETLPPALHGVERMYLAPYPPTVRHVVQLAQAAGVQRIVDLSSSDADDEAAGDPQGWYYYAVEHAVEQSDLAWTHLRPGEFMNNRLDWADQIRATGVVRAAYGQAATTVIDLDDIAAVAAQALLEDGHEGQKYVLTGPEALTRAEQAHQIGQAIGRNVRFDEQPHAEALAELSVGMGDYAQDYLDALAYFVAHPPAPSPIFATITGRPGTPFAQWAVRNAAAFQ